MTHHEPKDIRSTGRKRARKVLERSGRPYKCECMGECGKEHSLPCNYTPREQSRSDTLDADHINKNKLDNDPVNLKWMCRPCHKGADKVTEKGVSRKENEFGYPELP